jgi:7,8-dihydropterin-6-yl-methyl-4-(beta-D-ribofuranosyl)aminobenzene 5'-phosphate synthase
VDYDGHRLLFDTGAYGPILIDNMKRLGIDPWSIETIVISHDHYDHTGGMKYLLDMGIHPKIYLSSSFAIPYKDSHGSQIELIEVDDSVTIYSGLSLVCVKGMTVEEALVAETDAGSVVITGCDHPGVSAMIRSAQSLVPGKVSLLVGGFHLLQASDKTSLKAVAEDLRSFAVERGLPIHCTSVKAIGVFKAVFGDRALDGGVGCLNEYPSSSAASR